ncbi:MAG: uracil-DNA glycosylase [Chloroflexi bacterium]|nr:uracil-DNA glycosylase [Chloroflexota bacterium]
MSEQQSAWPSIEEIASEVVSCARCVLSTTRTHAVPGDGSSTAAVMFIGEGPGQNEDEQGLPFVGRAGKLLDTLLAEVPLRREDVFITNVVKCRPPGNRDPEPDEVSACMPYLNAQIELIDPRVIVTLGRHSMLRFYPEGKISNDHGRIIRIGSRVLLPVYHHAAALRNPRLSQTLREDMRRIPEAVRESLLLQSVPNVAPPLAARAGARPQHGPSQQRNTTAQTTKPPSPAAGPPAQPDAEDKGQISLF